MKGTECTVSLSTSVVLTDMANVVINSEEVIGTADYLTLLAGCRVNQCRYIRVQLFYRACFVLLPSAAHLPQDAGRLCATATVLKHDKRYTL